MSAIKQFQRKLFMKNIIYSYELVMSDIFFSLGTLFAPPEEKILTQGQKSNSMFFIISGKCQVSINTIGLKENLNKNFLTWGDHFGEIGCLYNTARTCNVTSMDFNILARLSKLKMRELCSNYPDLHD